MCLILIGTGGKAGKALLDNCRRDIEKALIRIATEGGLRRSEIMSLRWKNINLDSGEVGIRNTEDFQTKSRKNRTVYLQDETEINER